MSVSFWVDLLQLIHQRCVCVRSGVLVCFAPCDPGVCVLSPLCCSASCAECSDGVVPRRLWEQKPLLHCIMTFKKIRSIYPGFAVPKIPCHRRR